MYTRKGLYKFQISQWLKRGGRLRFFGGEGEGSSGIPCSEKYIPSLRDSWTLTEMSTVVVMIVDFD